MELPGKTSAGRRPWKAIVALGLLQLCFALFLVPPGYLVVDEVIYAWSARDLWQTGSLALENGYGEVASPELLHGHQMLVHEGRVFPQYPPLFPALASPLYAVLGLRGFFVLSSLAFAGTVALVHSIGRQLIGSRAGAVTAACIFAAASFSWDYALSAWSHMVAVFLMTAAFHLTIAGMRNGVPLSARRRSLVAAGLAAGFALGVRLDAGVIVPCLMAALLIIDRTAWRDGAWLAGGLAPGVLILAVANHTKLGTWQLLVYGTAKTEGTLSRAVPLLVCALLVTALVPLCLWLHRRLSLRHFRLVIVVSAMAAAAAFPLVPSVSEPFVKLFRNFVSYAVDIRQFDTSVPMPAMSRTASGAVVYMGSLKKALLQSSPWLALLAVPLVRVIRREGLWKAQALAGLVPVACVAVFSSLDFHGGLCLSMRYFLPVFPFAAVLCADVVAPDWERWKSALLSWLGAMLLSTEALYFFSSVRDSVSEVRREFALLGFPLLLAVVLLVTALLSEMSRSRGRLLRLVPFLGWAALEWSLLTTFFYDVPSHWKQRELNHRVGSVLTRLVPEDSLFFTAWYIDPVMELITRPGVRIALAHQDDFRDVPRLTGWHLDKDKRVFALFPAGVWMSLGRSLPFSRYQIAPVYSFLETSRHGPTLEPLGRWGSATARSPGQQFVLAEIRKKQELGIGY